MKKKFPLSMLLACGLALSLLQSPLLTAKAFASASKSEGEKDKGKKGESNEEEDISGGRFEGDPIYVHVKPLILPIINDQGVEQIVSVIVDVHVKDSETADALHKNMPRVIDALLRHLYGGLDDGSLSKGKLVNVARVKARAIRAVSEIVEKDKVVDVLIQGVSQRML
jgi:flagellar basal body-associated protein FliL